MADSLRCPNCGAPAPADAVRCDYCASTLKTVACPSCFASMFAGSQFCPHCGTRAVQVVEDAGLSLPCPNCNASMKPVHVGPTAMQQCEACNGSWLTTETFTALCTDREAQSALTSSLGAAPTASASLRLSGIRYRHCAACQKMMNRVNFGRVSGIVIDLCKGHGVWFDPGELQAILAFITNGGLERMRESEAEFKELTKKAWAAGAMPSGGDSVMQHLASDTTLRVHFTSSNDDSAPLRQLLTFLLT